MSVEVAEVIAELRLEGGDTTRVEVKKAAGGFPADLATTLSAFANTPGGGLIVLGLDEAGGQFEATGVDDLTGYQSRLAAVARQSLEPAVQIETSVARFEGASLVLAHVSEVDPQLKPVFVKSTRAAYRRSYDGDYRLSELEVQAFRANRGTPRFDQQLVEGAVREDLDAALLSTFLLTARESSPRLGRMDDEEILYHTGVTAGEHRLPTVAGLLSLGVYPQRFFPNYVIRASIPSSSQDPAGTRVADSARFDGPIPAMLDQAVQWVARNTRRRIAFAADGHGRDEPEYPRLAVRELVANALIHRDLGPHALGEAVTLRLERSQLLLSNPGGLYGLTVETLGRTGVTSARNGFIVAICQFVRSGDGRRVIEALATGIPAVIEELRQAGMTPPRFFDQGTRFAVRVPNHALLRQDDLTWLAGHPASRELSDVQRHALVEMKNGAVFTNSTFREVFPMDSTEALRALRELVDTGLVVPEGEKRARRYLFAGEDEQSTGRGPDKGTSPTTTQPVKINRNGDIILAALLNTPRSRKELVRATELTPRQVSYALSLLIESGTVLIDGGAGRRDTTYRLAPSTAER